MAQKTLEIDVDNLSADEINQELDRVNAMLAGVTPFRLAVAAPDDFREAPVNAHYMTQKTYRQLVSNIQRDGNLSTLPFAWHDEDGNINTLSGHHRVAAAKDAGIKLILYMYTNEEMSEEQRLAIQLSHNAINGQDDIDVLKRQWQSISSIEAKLYTGLDDEYFKTFDAVQLSPFTERDLTFMRIDLQFLPTEVDELVKAIETLQKSQRLKLVGMEPQHKQFADALMDAKAEIMILNTSTLFQVMIEATRLYCEFLGDKKEELTWEDWAMIHTKMLDMGLLNDEEETEDAEAEG